MARDLADQFREELRDFYRDRLILEQRIGKLEGFMLRFEKPPGSSDSKIKVNVADTEGKYKVIVAVILALQMIAIAVIAVLK